MAAPPPPADEAAAPPPPSLAAAQSFALPFSLPPLASLSPTRANIFAALELLWAFLKRYGWFLIFAGLAYVILRPPVEQWLDERARAAALAAARAPARVGLLDEDRRRVREEQQREFLADQEARALAEQRRRQVLADAAAEAAATAAASGNPQGAPASAGRPERKPGSFMGPGGAPAGAPMLFGGNRRRPAGGRL